MLKDTVKILCKRQGITVQKLEEMAGLSNGTISKWDKAKPKAESIEKVANCLGVSTDYLLGRTETVDIKTPNEIEIELETKYLDRAFALFQQMDEEQQKTAIRLLKALAAENNE